MYRSSPQLLVLTPSVDKKPYGSGTGTDNSGQGEGSPSPTGTPNALVAKLSDLDDSLNENLSALIAGIALSALHFCSPSTQPLSVE